MGARREALGREAGLSMARLAAGFGSSHSVMLASTLEDWLTGFRESDPRMPYYDDDGRRCSYADVLARAPADAEKHITPELITARFGEVQQAMQRMKAEIPSALHDAPLPIVPVFLNTYNPPNAPLPKRCLKLGAALKEAIDEYPEDLRVGVIASGGLSHFAVDERMDRAIIDALRAKDHAFLGALDPRKLKAGSSEIRNWLVVAGAAGALEMSWHSYTPAYRTPALTGTGLCFARWS